MVHSVRNLRSKFQRCFTSMFYSPIIDLYYRYQKHVNDFVVEVVIFLGAYLVDTFFVYNLKYNALSVSLGFFVICYAITHLVVKVKKKRDIFSVFGEHSLAYVLFFGWWGWVAYLIFVRLMKFPR